MKTAPPTYPMPIAPPPPNAGAERAPPPALAVPIEDTAAAVVGQGRAFLFFSTVFSK
jgi:hypothetical protein